MENKRTWTNNESEDLIRQLNIALEASGIGIWQHNLLKNQTRWDEQLQSIYGVPKGPYDVIWLDSLHPDDRDVANEIFEKAISERSDYASQFRIIRPDGVIRYLRSRAKFFIDGNGEPCFIGAEWDVTDDVLLNQQLALEREAAEQSRSEAKYAAEHDYLTGLMNRRSFDSFFENLCKQDNAQRVSLCHLDIDRFKEINDQFGHSAGDQVLQHVALTLSRSLADDEVAARLGGDEFVILSPSGTSERMKQLVSALRDFLKDPIEVNGRKLIIQCSMGIATAEGEDLGTLLSRSDIALYEAKRNGRNRYELFSPSLATVLAAEKINLYELREALGEGQIIPYYQAQVDAASHRLCGLEALARWNHPSGVRLPAKFLTVAANHGLIDQIDEAILQQVLIDMQQWQHDGWDAPRVSVNVSATRLADPALGQKLRKLDLPEGRISFELIETIVLDNLSDQVQSNIDMMRELGIEVEIDDLGSGHASLLGLVALRPDRVKIDRNLILPVVRNATERRLIGSLVEIARTLDTEVIAEGVETLDHAAILKDLGVDLLQGYAFGHPESATAIRHRFDIRQGS